MNFFSVFRVGWPPPWVFVRCMPPVLVWQGLTVLAPEADDGVRLSWAVIAYFTVFQWTRAIHVKRIAPISMQMASGRVAMVLWMILACLVLLAADPVWLQRWFTVINAVLAVLCIVDMIWDKGISVQGLSPSIVEKAGPQLVRAYFLFYLTLVILNETLIASLSLQAWVLCLSLLPLFTWVISRALTSTVLLSVDEQK